MKRENIKNTGIKISKHFGYLRNFSMKNVVQPRRVSTYMELVFS